MKRFSIANSYWKRICQTQEEFGGQWTPEQRQRMLPWPPDERFKYDPITKTRFFDEMPLTDQEVNEMRGGWEHEELIDSELPEIGKAFGIPEAKDISEIVYPIAEKLFTSTSNETEITKPQAQSYVKTTLEKAGASAELQNEAMNYLSNIFDILHTLERAEHIRQRSIKAIKSTTKINVAILSSYYKLMCKKAQVEEEWTPSPGQMRTIRRIDRIWALEEGDRLKKNQTPEEYYGQEYIQEPFPLLTQEQVNQILKETREEEDFVVPIEDMPADIEQEEQEADVVI